MAEQILKLVCENMAPDTLRNFHIEDQEEVPSGFKLVAQPSMLNCCGDCRYLQKDVDGDEYCSIGKAPVLSRDKDRLICIWWKWKEIKDEEETT